MLQPFTFSIQRRPYGQYKDIYALRAKDKPPIQQDDLRENKFAPNHLGMPLHPPSPQRKCPKEIYTNLGMCIVHSPDL